MSRVSLYVVCTRYFNVCIELFRCSQRFSSRRQEPRHHNVILRYFVGKPLHEFHIVQIKKNVTNKTVIAVVSMCDSAYSHVVNRQCYFSQSWRRVTGSTGNGLQSLQIKLVTKFGLVTWSPVKACDKKYSIYNVRSRLQQSDVRCEQLLVLSYNRIRPKRL